MFFFFSLYSFKIIILIMKIKVYLNSFVDRNIGLQNSLFAWILRNRINKFKKVIRCRVFHMIMINQNLFSVKIEIWVWRAVIEHRWILENVISRSNWGEQTAGQLWQNRHIFKDLGPTSAVSFYTNLLNPLLNMCILHLLWSINLV